MSDAQLDRLVDEITRRVQTRLGTVAPSAGADGASICKTGTGDPSEETCDTCQGCHVNRPDDVRKVIDLGAARVAAGSGHAAPTSDLAPLIDHSLLKPDATTEPLKKMCDEAKRYGFATVCVNATNVRFCAAQLEGSRTVAIAVVGFTLGAGTPNAKAYEAREAVRNGAQEIDMVINIGAHKDKDYALVLEDIQAVVAASAPKPVKVILETASLTQNEKVIACALSKIAGAAFVKTSTGFGAGGATAEDVALMRDVVGPELGVKASGGIHSAADVREMVAAGATRIGASASVAIVTSTSNGKAKKTRSSRGGY